jgi:uncharacterized membrane-anchored protein
MSKQLKQLILACAVPVIILLGMTATPLFTLINGEEIILQTVPVDPSDVFRGDYVTLRYEAEEVPKQLVDSEVITELESGRSGLKVYVLLEKKDGIHSPIKVTLNKPDKGIFLKGNLDYIGSNFEQRSIAYIQYSLDKYFVEDNTGLEWEKASAQGKILAKVKVSNGYAYLVDITTEN